MTSFNTQDPTTMKGLIRNGEYEAAREIRRSRDKYNEETFAFVNYQYARASAKLGKWDEAIQAIQQAKLFNREHVYWQTKLNMKLATYQFAVTKDAKTAQAAQAAFERENLEYVAEDMLNENGFETFKNNLAVLLAKTERSRTMIYAAEGDFDNAKSFALRSLFDLSRVLGNDHLEVAKSHLILSEVFAKSASAKAANKEDYQKDKTKAEFHLAACERIYSSSKDEYTKPRRDQTSALNKYIQGIGS